MTRAGSALQQVGCDFAPQTGGHRVRRMADFRWEPDAHMVQLLDRFMQSRWPARCRLADLSTSPYTITADQHFILDRLPGLEQVIIFAGDCGRGFKFSILLSKWVALDPPHAIAYFFIFQNPLRSAALRQVS